MKNLENNPKEDNIIYINVSIDNKLLKDIIISLIKETKDKINFKEYGNKNKMLVKFYISYLNSFYKIKSINLHKTLYINKKKYY